MVVLAQEEARLLNHNYIGTEHLLLGLIREQDGVAAHALHDVGVDLEAVRSKIKQLIGQGVREPSSHIPFTPRSKRVLELSLYEAKELGDSEIGTEHLLLGLVEEGEGVAAQVLNSMDADAVRVRNRILEIRGSKPESDTPESVTPAVKSAYRTSAMARRVEDLERRMTELEQRLGGSGQNDAGA
nr:Clp protease N-terminal domain-containing protein [Nocardia sp.]